MTLLSDMPTLIVEAAFGYGPFQLSKVWTDISAYVMRVTINRGRAYSLEDFAAGTCEIVLLNDSGRFHPMNLNGAYVSGGVTQLLPNTPIRVRGVWAGVSYQRFGGFAENWEPVRAGGRYRSVTTVTCSDVFGLFANWRFPIVDDGVGGGVKQMGTFNTAATTQFTAGASFLAGNEASRVYGLVDITELATGPPGSFENVALDVTYTNQSGVGNRLGQFNLQHRGSSIHPHHVTHRKQKGRRAHHGHDHDREGSWKAHIQMQVQGTDMVRSVDSVKQKSGVFTGKSYNLRIYGEQPLLSAALGDGQLAQAFAYGGVYASMLNVKHAGLFKQQPESPWDSTLLDVVHRVQDTELGQVYAGRNGVVQFEDRDWRYRNWSPTVWHDGAGAGALVFADCVPVWDSSQIVTQWEVTRVSSGPSDTPQRQVASASQAVQDQYGNPTGQRAPYLAGTLTVSAEQWANRQAQYLLAKSKQPQYRYSRVTIKPRSNPNLMWPTALQLDISSAMTINEYPPLADGSSFLVSSDQWLEHIAETITPDNWVFELETSPRQQIAFPP